MNETMESLHKKIQFLEKFPRGERGGSANFQISHQLLNIILHLGNIMFVWKASVVLMCWLGLE